MWRNSLCRWCTNWLTPGFLVIRDITLLYTQCVYVGSYTRFDTHGAIIVSAARSLTCRDDLDSKWRLLLAENELSRVSLLSRISIEN